MAKRMQEFQLQMHMHLYQGLMDMEVDTELIIFKGMAYSSDQPGVHVAIMKQNLMWFSHYILGESMEGF